MVDPRKCHSSPREQSSSSTDYIYQHWDRPVAEGRDSEPTSPTFPLPRSLSATPASEIGMA
ncbi:hypothetical protein PtB15_10B579 [Puccinia triticina]|nr:hypothetical protein PtB15_10B579 [Puccinia triticina]